MAGNMGFTVKKSFPNAILVIDRFRIQKLALDALQEIRTKHRWEAIDSENDAIENVSSKVLKHTPELLLLLLLLLLLHRDTLKQLLARSRYLLYKSSYK
jgi:transposase